MTRTALPSAPAATIAHRDAAAIAEVAYGRFADVVETLSAEDWTRETDCTGWTVRDLVGHLVGAMRSAASLRELFSQQREVKDRVAREGGNETDRMTQVQIERTAGLSTTELTRECRSLVGPAAAGRRRTPLPMRRLVRFPVEFADVTESWDLGYLVDVILTRDTWLHRVDLCRATGSTMLLTPEHDGRVVADVVGEWARRHGRPYRLELVGPAGGSFSEGVGGPGLHLEAVEFCRVLSGRAPGEGLLATPVPF